MPEKLPLSGIRVIDFTWMWAGPYATLQLAHLGAEVIRVESETKPCMNRRIRPFADDIAGLNRGGSFNQWNQGKYSFALDMKHPQAHEVFLRLIKRSDVLVENFASGVLERMGLGYQHVSRANPSMIMASLSGYGQSGPLSSQVAFGNSLTMISGLGTLSGYPDLGPSRVGISYGDPNGGLHAVVAILAALWKRRTSGEGAYVDISQLEALLAVMPQAVLATSMGNEEMHRDGNRSLDESPHGVFPCAGDDRWVAIVAKDDAQWRALANVVGGHPLQADPRFTTLHERKRNEDELEDLIAQWTSKLSPEEVTAELQKAGVAASPVLDMAGVAHDSQLDALGVFVRLPHAEVGVRQHIGPPWRFSNSRVEVRRPAPLLGEHTAEIATGLLGYTEAEYKQLLDAGVFN